MKIAIEGNIGSGKTSLALALGEATRLPIFLEPVHEWREGLSLFYTDERRWAMTFNINALLAFDGWRNTQCDALFERSPQSCRKVFTQLHVDSGKMTAYELATFDQLYDRLAWKPDAVLYVRTDPAVCLQRMRARGRECEALVEGEYLHRLHAKYEAMVADMDPAELHVVDGNQAPELVVQQALEALRSIRSP